MKCVLIILLVIPLLSGCKDDDLPKPQHWERSDLLDNHREYIYFDVGTWWVYERFPGGELDTIEVVQSLLDTTTLQGGGNTMYFEYCNWLAKSHRDNYEYRFYLPLGFPDPAFQTSTSTYISRYFLSRFKPGNYVGQSNVYFSPNTIGNSLNNATHNTTLESVDDTLTIPAGTFNYVRRVYLTHDATFIYDDLGRHGGKVKYWWAPGVGIIQKEHLTEGIIWKLKEYYIVQ